MVYQNLKQKVTEISIKQQMGILESYLLAHVLGTIKCVIGRFIAEARITPQWTLVLDAFSQVRQHNVHSLYSYVLLHKCQC